MADTFRLALTIAGLIDVEGTDAKEAMSIAEQTLKRGGLVLAGSPVLNVQAAISPVVKIDNKPLTLKDAQTHVSTTPKKVEDHDLKVQDVALTAKVVH